MDLHLLCLLCLSVAVACNEAAMNCTPTPNDGFCSCTGSDFTIDFRKILQLPVNNIRDAYETGAYTYNFDPCQLLSCVDDNNGIVCQNSVGATGSFYLAKNTVPPVWTIAQLDPLQFTVTYSGGDKTEGGDEPMERQAILIFQHQKDKDLDIAMISEASNNGYLSYTFLASSKTVTLSRGSQGGVAVGVVGLVLLILFIVALVSYFFLGAIVNYHYRGARGAEVIPNYTLWKDLPFLVKDGFLFIISPCRKRSDYQKF